MIHDPVGIKLLNRQQVGFSHFWKRKFRHDLADTLCACALVNDCTEYFNAAVISFGTTLMSELSNIDSSLVSCSCNDILKLILYGDKSFRP